jgi:hypothetical protein
MFVRRFVPTTPSAKNNISDAHSSRALLLPLLFAQTADEERTIARRAQQPMAAYRGNGPKSDARRNSHCARPRGRRGSSTCGDVPNADKALAFVSRYSGIRRVADVPKGKRTLSRLSA